MGNTHGRERNAAQDLGDRAGTTSKGETERTGRRERKTAGPDGPAAEAVGDTFKRKPQ